MSSFVYQPGSGGREEELEVVSSFNKENEQPASGAKSLKRSVLHESSSKLRRQSRESNREKGLTYSSQTLAWELEEQEGGRKDRSLKIDCSGPADIVPDLQELAYEYVPKRRKIGQPTAEKAGRVAGEQLGEARQSAIADVRESQEWKESWDRQVQRQKRMHYVYCFMLLVILAVFSTRARDFVFVVYAALRSLWSL